MVCYSLTGFSNSEIRQAAQIQISEINQGFLSSFGEKPLGLVFKYIAKSHWGIMVLAVDDISNEVIGYVLGTPSSSKLYLDFLLKKGLIALIYFLPHMFSVKRISKAIETLLYPSHKPIVGLPTAELLDLAVNSQYHGKGVAQGLFLKLRDEFFRRGIMSFKITTGASLTRAHRFYEKMGAQSACSFELHRGEKTIVYVYNGLLKK